MPSRRSLVGGGDTYSTLLNTVIIVFAAFWGQALRPETALDGRTGLPSRDTRHLQMCAGGGTPPTGAPLIHVDWSGPELFPTGLQSLQNISP